MCKRTKHFCVWVAPMKIVASIGENSDSFGLHLNCGVSARREKEYTHYADDWQSLISIFFYILKKCET